MVLIGGGVAALGAGTYLWITAPSASSRTSVAMAGAGGRF
jgi:hypothetical protein